MLAALAWLLLAAILAVARAEEDPYDRMIRWDYWGPLPSRPYFTGQYLSSQPGGIHLPRQDFTVLDPFNPSSSANALLYGSILFRPHVPADVKSDPAVQAAFAAVVKHIKSQANVHVSPSIAVAEAVVYPLRVTGDNGKSEMAILQEYSGYDGMPLGFRSFVTFGDNWYLTLDDPSFNLRHRVVVALDRDGRHNIFQHTFMPLDASAEAQTESESTHGSSLSGPRILSYNVWNTNPSADVYGGANRWKQYTKRLDLLAQYVKESGAGTVGFQEVRYDGAFGGLGNHAQVQHLAGRLPGYQYVYQAAMSYLNARAPYERIEEGPAVFSKFPIVATDYLLLSRDPNDPNDSHQRLCLHAVIDYPQWGLIDVYVTHLSLSERSREQTKLEVWEYMKQGRGVTQVLLGDLNSEPQSLGMQFLSGKAELLGETTDLKDAWLEKHEEAEPRSTDWDDRQHRFTFPSDNPSKRIDFVLYRGRGSVKECEIVGQEPTEDTKGFPLDVGMLNAKSPVYASDHRAVVVEFE